MGGTRSGGLELLFDKQKSVEVEFAEQKEIPLKDLLVHIRDNLVKERPEFFMQDDSV